MKFVLLISAPNIVSKLPPGDIFISKSGKKPTFIYSFIKISIWFARPGPKMTP